MSFDKYYQHYLSLHQNLWCRRLHVLGQTFTIAYAIMCLTKIPLVFALLAPFIVYPFAWSGHYFFEKNEPAAFKKPLYAKLAEWVMINDRLIGRIQR